MDSSAVGLDVYRKGTRMANAFAEGRWMCTTARFRVEVSVVPFHSQFAIWTGGVVPFGASRERCVSRPKALHVVAITRPCAGRMSAESVSSDVIASA